jgi:uncharacterized phage-like protein YoqJ
MESCCFTGHRLLPTGEAGARLTRLTEDSVRDAYCMGCRRFFAGGALGFDMLAAAVVCHLRDTELADISLHLILPCRDQDSRWSARDRERYQKMLLLADSHVYLYDAYANGVMAARNRALVNAADLCIAYMTTAGSGTGLTVSMAERRGIPVWNLAKK